jgi:hypothetical protein
MEYFVIDSIVKKESLKIQNGSSEAIIGRRTEYTRKQKRTSKKKNSRHNTTQKAKDLATGNPV